MSHDELIRRALLHATPHVARPGFAIGGNPADAAGGVLGAGSSGGNAGAKGSAGGTTSSGSSLGGGGGNGGGMTGGGGNAGAVGGVRDGGWGGAGTSSLSASAAAQRPTASPGPGNVGPGSNLSPAGGGQTVNRQITADRISLTPSQQLASNFPDIAAQSSIPNYDAVAALMSGMGAIDMSVMNAINPSASKFNMETSPGFNMANAAMMAQNAYPGQIMGTPMRSQPVRDYVGSTLPQTGLGPRQVVSNSAAKGDLMANTVANPMQPVMQVARPTNVTTINQTVPTPSYDPLAAAEMSASSIPAGYPGAMPAYHQPMSQQTVGNLVAGLGGAYPNTSSVMPTGPAAPQNFNMNGAPPTAAQTAAANAQLDAMMARAMALQARPPVNTQTVNTAPLSNPAGPVPSDLDISRALELSNQFARPSYNAGYFTNGYTPDVSPNRVSVTPAGDYRQNFGPVSATPDSDYRAPPSHRVVNDEAGNARGEGGINRHRKDYADAEAAAAAAAATPAAYPLMLQPLPEYVPYQLPVYTLPEASPLVQQYINSISGNNSISNALRSAVG